MSENVSGEFINSKIDIVQECYHRTRQSAKALCLRAWGGIQRKHEPVTQLFKNPNYKILENWILRTPP